MALANMSIYVLYDFLQVIAAGLAEAALFVYRPERLKALPWIILVVMGIVIAGSMEWNSYNFSFCFREMELLIACSIPIVTLFFLPKNSKRKKALRKQKKFKES